MKLYKGPTQVVEQMSQPPGRASQMEGRNTRFRRLDMRHVTDTRSIRGIVFSEVFALMGMICVMQSSPAKADVWRGTAPFCEGKCLAGEAVVQTSTTGDGAKCLTGHKVLCRGRTSSPTCLPLQTNVACRGVVLICYNGFYTQSTSSPDWHNCSTYACGACLGWWSDWKEPAVGTARGFGEAAGISPLSLRSISSGPHSPHLPNGPDTCKSGFVWREAIQNDHVCVTPASREEARRDNSLRESRVSRTSHRSGPDTCIPGYVWREVVPSDHVCVLPQTRQRTKVENSHFERNRARGVLW